MAVFPNFCGPSNPARSPQVDNERTVNFYPVLRDAGTPKAKIWLYPTPGHVPFVELGDGPVRCLWTENQRAFAVSGEYFWEIFADGTAVIRGEVAEDEKNATISSNGINGHQLFVTSGGFGYIYDLQGNTLTLITDDAFPFPALSGCYINGFFIVLTDDAFITSEINDGLIWSRLDENPMIHTSDLKIAMIASHTELWLWGTKRTEVWSPNLSVQGHNAFVPNPASPIDHGIAATNSAVILDNTVFWLMQDENGQGLVMRASGYTPTRISTFALENILNGLPRMDDAIGWAYSQEGHLYYVLLLPAAETTWVYDVATNLWHERAVWHDTLMRFVPHVGRCHTFAFDRHLVGDRQSGAVYDLRLDTFYDELIVKNL